MDRSTTKLMVSYEPTGDSELDAIAICIDALNSLPEQNARCRVVEYLMQRFGERIVEVKTTNE